MLYYKPVDNPISISKAIILPEPLFSDATRFHQIIGALQYLTFMRPVARHPRGVRWRFFVCFLLDLVLWSRHLVFWSLETLTGLSEILRHGTGCVKGRY